MSWKTVQNCPKTIQLWIKNGKNCQQQPEMPRGITISARCVSGRASKRQRQCCRVMHALRQPLSLEGFRDSSYVCYASNISMSMLFPVRNHPCPLQRALRTQNQDHFQRTQPLLSWEVLIVLHEWQSRSTPPGLFLPVIGDYMHSRGVAQALPTPYVHTKSWLTTRTCQTSGKWDMACSDHAGEGSCPRDLRAIRWIPGAHRVKESLIITLPTSME